MAALEPLAEIDTQLTDAMVGDYGRHRVRLEEGRLYFDWFGVDAGEMIYTKSGVFRLDGIKDYRVEPKRRDGKVTTIQEHYFDGRGLNLHPKVP